MAKPESLARPGAPVRLRQRAILYRRESGRLERIMERHYRLTWTDGEHQLGDLFWQIDGERVRVYRYDAANWQVLSHLLRDCPPTQDGQQPRAMASLGNDQEAAIQFVCAWHPLTDAIKREIRGGFFSESPTDPDLVSII